MPGADNNLLIKILIVIPLAVILVVTLGPMIRGYFRTSQVLKNGIAAEARITEISDTGRRHNDNPVVRIKMMINDPQGRQFPAEVKTVISPVDMTKAREGSLISVKYLPDKPDNVAIVSYSRDSGKR